LKRFRFIIPYHIEDKESMSKEHIIYFALVYLKLHSNLSSSSIAAIAVKGKNKVKRHEFFPYSHKNSSFQTYSMILKDSRQKHRLT